MGRIDGNGAEKAENSVMKIVSDVNQGGKLAAASRVDG